MTKTRTTESTAIEKTQSPGQLANQRLAEIGDFKKLNGDKIELMQPPFNIRNNKSAGMWALDEETMIAKSIKISIIKCTPYYGKLGKGEPCKWMQIWFVAAPEETNIPQNLVCVTYAAKQSVTELAQKLTMVRTQDNSLAGIWTCGFKRHSNEKGDYYSVSWDWERMEPTPENNVFIDKLIELLTKSVIGNPFTDSGLPSSMFPVTGTDEEAIARYEEWKQTQTERA